MDVLWSCEIIGPESKDELGHIPKTRCSFLKDFSSQAHPSISRTGSAPLWLMTVSARLSFAVS